MGDVTRIRFSLPFPRRDERKVRFVEPLKFRRGQSTGDIMAMIIGVVIENSFMEGVRRASGAFGRAMSDAMEKVDFPQEKRLE